MKFRLLLALLPMLLPAAGARADWQFTHWGQSLADSLKMTDHGVVVTTDGEKRSWSGPINGEALAKTHYETPDFSATAYLTFRKDKLSGVMMSIHKPDGVDVIRWRLLQQYGNPVVQSDTERGCKITNYHWRDEARGNAVSYIMRACPVSPDFESLLVYSPILSASDTGL